jgi:thymidylate synthase
MISGISVSDAYLAMLADTLNSGDLMQITQVTKPVIDGRVNVAFGFEDKLRGFRFPDGRTSYDWLQNRMRAMFDSKGEYWGRISKDGKYDYIVQALKGMKEGTHPRWNANRLIVSLFETKDLHKSRNPTPPCMISLCFYPQRDRLSLIATFRAQYTDAKGFGNLYSLATLLQRTSAATGFTPDRLYNVAQKAILKYPPAVARQFYLSLRE